MQISLKSRKPIDELREEDLEAFPIWEFALDEENTEEQDETWVKPVDSQVIPKNSYSLSVAARFKLASGKTLLGLVEVTTDHAIELGHAALLPTNNYIFIPSNTYWNAAVEYEKVAALLELKIEDVFPLYFELLALIEGETTHRTGEYRP
jgi:hypothetical protein